jgi:dimethylhistidine N-methyltransferase
LANPSVADLSIADAGVDPRAALLHGLLQEQAAISPKYFYDALGSRLFQAICELPEYYPTRTEAAIFSRYLPHMANAIGKRVTLIDLGAGDCQKAARLFPALQPRRYVAVDISGAFLAESLACLQRQFPALAMQGVVLDFTQHLVLPDGVENEGRLVFYPGSSIGNFTPEEATAFLRRVREVAGNDGALLIGVDLVKEKAVLDAAYDDALGVTAAFNRNMLSHVNRVLGADFNLADWRHVAFFNPVLSRIEMHLEACRDTRVRFGRHGERRFAEGERIHTESSYKYRLADFTALLEGAGFGGAETWTDEQGWFAVCLARCG